MSLDRGREGMTAEQILRFAIVMRLFNWSYDTTRRMINQSIELRRFGRFADRKLPNKSNLCRQVNRIDKEGWDRIIGRLNRWAAQEGYEDGAKARGDATAVETNIRYPTDYNLLYDSVRVLTRLVLNLKKIRPQMTNGFSKRLKRAKRRQVGINRTSRSRAKGREKKLRSLYRDLVKVTCEVVDKAERIACEGLLLAKDFAVMGICHEIEHYMPLCRKAISQVERRVFNGENVPASEKIYSLFEPHTKMIIRGKAGKKIEFGHKAHFHEVASGLIVDYHIMDASDKESALVLEGLAQHYATFGRMPEVYAGDKGQWNPVIVAEVEKLVPTTAIPKKGYRNHARRKLEKSPKFKNACGFRAGVEGRISVLKRARGMARSLNKGFRNFSCFIAHGVFVNNLVVVVGYL